MTMTKITTPEPQVPRDYRQRPLIIPPEGGAPVAYTRCTTFVDCVDDKFGLQQWERHMDAIGLSMRPDLLLAVSAHRDDWREMQKIVNAAKEAAAANAKATIGTAVHKLAEHLDRGLDVGAVPEAYQADLASYTEATKDLKAIHIERFMVLDKLQIGGTPDRIVKFKGKNYIADIKTGDIEKGAGKIAAQLAVYARSHLYDVKTGERTAPGVDFEHGLVIHLPAGEGRCELVWTDLLEGWQNVQVARAVRERRQVKYADLCMPFAIGPDTLADTLAASVPVEQQIEACSTADEVRALWTEDWTEDLNDLARKHIAGLAAAS